MLLEHMNEAFKVVAREEVASLEEAQNISIEYCAVLLNDDPRYNRDCYAIAGYRNGNWGIIKYSDE